MRGRDFHPALISFARLLALLRPFVRARQHAVSVSFIIGGSVNPPLLRCASDADELREALGRFLREGTWMEERIVAPVDPGD